MTGRTPGTAPVALPRHDLDVVALGGGHGLAASLAGLRRVVTDLTAVVTVADNGGSSGRLREEFRCLPPGDLRMALAALCGDDEWGRTWADVLQYRFHAGGDLHEHAVGNLLIVALWELLSSHVGGLDLVARLLQAQGRVLPMAETPLDIAADVELPDGRCETVRGQVEVATTEGRVLQVRLDPAEPAPCGEALTAIGEADWVVGPGSWFTSVIPHLLVPDLRRALEQTEARRMVVLNLAPQTGETTGFTPERYLETLADHAPDLRIDVVLADPSAVADHAALRSSCEALGARLLLADVACDDGSPRHDVDKLALAYAEALTTT